MSVNLSPFAGAGAQFFTDAGTPLTGGLLYSYAAGTTTPATTYTSSDGLTANSNPIVLDSAGRVPYEIWLTAGVSYKFVLKTSVGTTVGTWDNIDGINDVAAGTAFYADVFTTTAGQTTFTLSDNPGSINNLTVSLDGAVLTAGQDFTWTGTTLVLSMAAFVGQTLRVAYSSVAGVKAISPGSVVDASVATGTKLYNRINDIVDVRDYGAKGDGVTDDTAAIQAALDTGKCVLGVSGDTYLISSTLNMTVSGTQFDGHGCNFKVKSGTLTGAILQGKFFNLAADRLILCNFTIPYNAAASFSTSVDANGMPILRTAIGIGTCKDSILEGIKIVNDRSAGVGTWNGGFRMTGGHTSNVTISNNELIQVPYGADYCPDSYSGIGNRVLNNRFEDCFYNIAAGDPLIYTSTGNIVEGNTIAFTTFSGYMGIEDYSGANYLGTTPYGVYGTRIVRNTIMGSATSTALYYAISAVSKDTVVDGNVITDWNPSLTTGTAAIEVGCDSGIVVTNNMVRWTNTPEGVTGTGRLGILASGDYLNGGNRYIGNKFENANYGMWLHPATTNTNSVIQGNTFRGCARAIYCDGAASSLSIASNIIEITRPQTASRDLVYIYASRAEITGNIIEFEAASSQNTYTTAVFRVAGDNVTIANNFGNCGGYSFTAEVIAIWAAGATPTNCLVTNNTFIGGMRCYYDSFTQVQGFGNVVPVGIHGVSNNKLAFYDGQTPVVQPTGYGTPTNVSKTLNLSGTTATLAQVGGTLAALIADLKSQNLIGS